jgi:hypothetical protein
MDPALLACFAEVRERGEITAALLHRLNREGLVLSDFLLFIAPSRSKSGEDG